MSKKDELAAAADPAPVTNVSATPDWFQMATLAMGLFSSFMPMLEQLLKDIPQTHPALLAFQEAQSQHAALGQHLAAIANAKAQEPKASA